jgi:hypothetical protein
MIKVLLAPAVSKNSAWILCRDKIGLYCTPIMGHKIELGKTDLLQHRPWDMGVLLVFGAPCQIRGWRGRSTAGPSH